MELFAVLLMLFAGGAIALLVAVAAAIARSTGGHAVLPGGAGERGQIAASLLFHIVAAGGATRAESLRLLRQQASIVAPVVSPIDLPTWGGRFAQLAPREDRERLLTTAVSLACAGGRTIPLMQYVALLDLSFALGFRIDALARLRDQLGFEYLDYARVGRPVADNVLAESGIGGGGVRDTLLQTLEVEGEPTRQVIIASYRRLVALHHPDRYHAADVAKQEAAARRFIEITRAYDALLAIYRE